MVKRERGQLRAEILQVVIEMLHRHQDPDLVSVDAVVSAVGCTPPALYYYFPTKADLLREACRLQYDAFAVELESATQHTGDGLADLRSRGEAYLDWARAHPATYRLLFMTPLALDDTTASTAPESAPDFRDVPGLGALVRSLESLAATGYPIGDPNLAAFALWGVVHGFASLSVTEPQIPQDFLKAAMYQASRGILPPS